MTPARHRLLCLAILAAACGGSRPAPLPEEPTIQLSKRELAFAMDAYASGSLTPASDEVLVSSSAPLGGAPTASVQYEAGSDWLIGGFVARAPGFALAIRPAQVGFLSAGTYRATLFLRWDGAAAPVSVAVALTIRPHPQTWQAGAPNVTGARSSFTLTALADGGALAAGGTPTEATIERLDPRTGTWALAGTFRDARSNHSATLLADGRVLFAGGQSLSGAAPGGTWELWDPTAGVHGGIVASGPLRKDRWYHAAVRLLDGEVLLVGGLRRGDDGVVRGTRSCELFDPTTGRSTETGALNGDAPEATTAVLLPDGSGRVLAITRTPDGAPVGAEIYTPGTGSWTVAASRAQPRLQHGTVALRDGRVLVFGGRDPGAVPQLRSSELYDPVADRWSPAGDLVLPHGYVRDAAVLLSDGRALVAGGALTGDPTFDQTEVVEAFDPVAGTWTIAGALRHPRILHAVTVLRDGRVFAVGGIMGMVVRDDAPDFWRPPVSAP